ncbi:MAG TPA: hypothetical protein VLK84_00410 [Longimicrobium sp.]|nr:hypothetical protein [Longimicrobium sp.]
MKMLLLAGALIAAAGACGQAERLAAPDGGRPAADAAPLPGDGGQAPRDETPPPPAADTTGRWGGGLGSGT